MNRWKPTFLEDEKGLEAGKQLGPKYDLLPSSGLLPSISRRFIPAFLRHGVYHLAHRTRQAVRYESETGAKFLALPVAFAIGALFYFSLPREPMLVALVLALIIFTVLSIKTYGRLSGNFALVVTFVFAGMTAGKLRSDLLDTTMIERPVQARLTGVVLNREQRSSGRQRYTIAVDRFEGKRLGATPGKIRVTAHAKYPLVGIGEGISGLVRLRPPSGPAYPGSYDFAFQAWFVGIGGNGFFLGAPKVVPRTLSLPLFSRAGIWVAASRADIGARIRSSLPGESGNLAAALIVGDRSGIAEDTTDALRRSGLAHILAISGLHMALVTATIIFLVRGSLALIPSIALYYPIRKWAAGCAMAAATVYLVISGTGIATQRAWIMIVIMLLAVLADRRALTMRNVGFAALVVLAWRPESIAGPSFQMSFAAVAALIAVYEGWSRYRQKSAYQQPSSRLGAMAMRSFKAVSGLAVTSMVAGIATGLFAAYHFHRIAPFGLLANLAAMPLVSLAVMPMALAAMVLMPFGLEVYPLALMGMAIDQVVDVAAWVSNLGPSGNTGFLPLMSLLLGASALTMATLLKTRLRLLALPLVALALLIYSTSAPPDILISESGSSIGVVDSAGKLQLLNPRKEKFITNIWKSAFAPGEISRAKGSAYRCDELGCTIIVGSGMVLAITKRVEAFQQDCLRADIIVTRLKVPDECLKPQLIVDKNALKKHGSHTITLAGHRMNIETSHVSSHRPWTRHRR